MAGLLTYNGVLLIKGGGLAGSKGCCCTGVTCFCVVQTVNYSQIVARWVQCYRNQYWNPILAQWVYPDGVPCGYGDSPCPPGTTGWFYRASSAYLTTPWAPTDPPPGFPSTCGCGGVNGSGYNLSVIDNATKAAGCTTILPPP